MVNDAVACKNLLAAIILQGVEDAKRLRWRRLFSIDNSFHESDLSDDLRHKFKQHKITFTDEATTTETVADMQWRIRDSDDIEYILSKENGRIVVYREYICFRRSFQQRNGRPLPGYVDIHNFFFGPNFERWALFLDLDIDAVRESLIAQGLLDVDWKPTARHIMAKSQR